MVACCLKYGKINVFDWIGAYICLVSIYRGRDKINIFIDDVVMIAL